jgi:hypothetical protein
VQAELNDEQIAKLNWIIEQGDQNKDGKWDQADARIALNFFAPGKDSAFFNYLWGKLNVNNDDFIDLDELKLLVQDARAWSKMLEDAEAASTAAAEAKMSAAQNMLNAARATVEPAAAELAKAAHLRWHPENPLEEIEIVRALVEQDSPALAGPGCAPSALGVVGFRAEPMGRRPIHPMDLPQLAGGHELAEFPVNRIGALIEHGRKNLAGAAVGGEQLERGRTL